jgi:hypothetical protein
MVIGVDFTDWGLVLMAAALPFGLAASASEVPDAAVAAYFSGDYSTAFRQFLPLAKSGLPRAQFFLGVMPMVKGLAEQCRGAEVVSPGGHAGLCCSARPRARICGKGVSRNSTEAEVASPAAAGVNASSTSGSCTPLVRRSAGQ